MAANDINVKLTIDATDFNSGLKAAETSVDNLQAKTDDMGKTTKKAMDDVAMSTREMRAEIRRLESTFGSLSGEALKQAQIQVGKLRNEMGDMRKMMKTVGEDNIPILVNGIRGLVGVTQTVTGSLSALGVETKGLDKAMLGLINVSMGLNQVWEMYEKKTLQATTSLIKNTIATNANTAANNANNIATKALYTTIAANPLVAVTIGVAALAAGIYYLATANDEEAEAAKKSREEKEKQLKANEELAKQAAGEMSTMMQLIAQIDNETASRKQRQAAIDKLDKMYPGYLDKMDKEKLLAGDTEEAYSKMSDAIMKKAVLNVYQTELNDVLVKQIAAEQNLAQITEKSDAARKKALEEHIKLFGTAEKFTFIDLVNGEERVKAQDEYNKAFDATGKVMQKVKNAQMELNKLIDISISSGNKNKENKRMAAMEEMMMIQRVALMREEDAKKQQKELAEIGQEIVKSFTMTKPAEVKKMVDEYVDIVLQQVKTRSEEIDITNIATPKETLLDIILGNIDEIEKRIKTFTEGYKSITEIVNNLNEIEANNFKAIQEEQTEQLQDEYDKRLAAAGNNAYKKKQVEEWFTNESKKLSEDLEKQQEEIDRKNKLRNQILAAGQATMDYAQGLVKIWAENSAKVITIPQAVALSALLTGVYATNLAVIKSQKFAHGGTDVLDGPSHNDGGVWFGRNKEAEGGERWAIFNREATMRNTGLADLIDDINLHNLVIDKDFMKKVHGNDNAVVLINNFKGGEHIKAIREYLESGKGGDKYLPDGRIQKGITKRRYN